MTNHTPNDQESGQPRHAELDLTNPTRTDTREVESNAKTAYGNVDPAHAEQGITRPASTPSQPAQINRPIPGRAASMAGSGTSGMTGASRDTQD